MSNTILGTPVDILYFSLPTEFPGDLFQNQFIINQDRFIFISL